VDKRFEQFYNFIAAHPLSTEREIAEGVGLKKTPYSRWILHSLMASNYIARHWQEDRVPRPAYVFYCQDTVPMDLQ